MTPTHCPDCNTELQDAEDGEGPYCPDPDCSVFLIRDEQLDDEDEIETGTDFTDLGEEYREDDEDTDD